MCRANGLVFHQKSLDKGPILVKKSLDNGPILVKKILRRAPFHTKYEQIVKSVVLGTEKPLEMGLDL